MEYWEGLGKDVLMPRMRIWIYARFRSGGAANAGNVPAMSPCLL